MNTSDIINPLHKSLGTKQQIKVMPMYGRLRLSYRRMRFALESLAAGDFDFFFNAVCAHTILIYLSLKDFLINKRTAECNICGWVGNKFYPNTGPGYYIPETTCPHCLSEDRYRTLAIILDQCFNLFNGNYRVIEVAPERPFESYCLLHNNLNYTSFDIERHAMEHGDITNMRFEDSSVDFFLCSHVLEHIPDEDKALKEISRILKPSGYALIQVPIFQNIDISYEYPAPDPRETGHVRRYGRDFKTRLASKGFKVTEININSLVPRTIVERFGLTQDSFFAVQK